MNAPQDLEPDWWHSGLLLADATAEISRKDDDDVIQKKKRRKLRAMDGGRVNSLMSHFACVYVRGLGAFKVDV